MKSSYKPGKSLITDNNYTITDIKSQKKNENRVNIFINDKYEFSLDISQVVDLGVKKNRRLSNDDLQELKAASEFGKLYSMALTYALIRPRSQKEVNDYLRRKTFDSIVKSGKVRKGYTKELVEQVLNKLILKGHIDEVRFARFWIENRFQKKGVSSRRLRAELYKKGVDESIINEALSESDRSEEDEILKVISKKRNRYDDKKLIEYLVRQGFDYNASKKAVEDYQPDV